MLEASAGRASDRRADPMIEVGRFLNAACLSLFLATSATAASLEVKLEPVEVFDPGNPTQTVFGRLEFMSGAVLTGDHEYFGGFSGLRFVGGDTTLFAITDKARFIVARMVREDGRVTAITDATISRATNASGKTITGAEDKDSEAIEIMGDRIAVAFERNDRVMIFEKKNETLFVDPDQKITDLTVLGLPNNRGPEALAVDPKTGNLIALAEHALNPKGDHRAFIIQNGDIVREVALKLRDGFSVTDAAFDQSGNLWVLERYYSVFIGVFMRVRLIERATIDTEETWDGEIMISAGPGTQIDNMEGIALTQMDDGAIRVTMISDDNFSKRQRTLLLEFRYVP